MIKELIERTVGFEERGCRFYEDLARKAEGHLARALFENLARDERHHATVIRGLAPCADGDGGEPSVTDAIPIEDRVRDVFTGLDQQAEGGGEEIIRGLEVAMTMEEKAIALYRDMLAENPSPRERVFIEAILQEEWQHLEALRSVHFYLTRTGEWFDQEESHRWNWMNV